MVWHRVLLLDVGSSSSHPLNPGQHYFLQALDVDLHVDSEAIWENELRHNVTITFDLPKYHDVDVVFGFHQYQ